MDCYIIYDSKQSSVGRYLSANIRKLDDMGARVWYYERDSLPGRDIFDSHFRLLAKSKKALSIITPDDSNYANYLHTTAEREMIENGKPYAKIEWCGQCEGMIEKIAGFIESHSP